MMPPKKSKAAREKAEEEPEKNGETQDAGSESEDGPSPAKKPKKEVNIFQEALVEGKRARTIPQCDIILNDWINEHIESKEGSGLNQNDTYDAYIDSCLNKAVNGVEQIKFNKVLNETYPEGYTIKEDSVYKKKVKEKKKSQKKKNTVKGETLKLKLRDIIKGALQDLGNPKSGVRFFNLKQYISAHFPALQIDLKPDSLKSALEKQVKFGIVTLVKGVGKAGFYRLPGGEDDEEEEKEKGAKKEEGEEKDDDKEEGDDKTPKKKKDEDGKDDKDEKDEEADGKDDEEEGEKKKPKKAAAKSSKKSGKKDASKNKKKKSAPHKVYRRFILHSDPQRIEETFPLAFTYMSEPKEASVARIKKYIYKHYRIDDLDFKIPKVLEQGLEKGWWSQVSGHGASGTYRLELAEYDASADDDLIGMVMNSLVACNEKKTCSARLLKEYVADYHQKFRINDRHHLYKLALERAAREGQIRQITGLGASGSYTLNYIFEPNPIILQGRDKAADYDSDGNFASDEEDEADYKPRASKRGGHGRSSAAGVAAYDASHQPGQRARKDSKYAEGSDEDGEEEELKHYRDAYVPRPSKKRAKTTGVKLPASKAKPRKRPGWYYVEEDDENAEAPKQEQDSASDWDYDEVEDSDDSDYKKSDKKMEYHQEAYVPRPTKRSHRDAAVGTSLFEAERKLSLKPVKCIKSHKKSKPAESSHDEATKSDHDEEAATDKKEKTKTPKRGRKAGKKKKGSKKGRAAREKEVEEDEEEAKSDTKKSKKDAEDGESDGEKSDVDEDESKKPHKKRALIQKGKSKADMESEEDKMSDEEAEDTKSKKKRSKKGKQKKSKRKEKAKLSDSEEDEDDKDAHERKSKVGTQKDEAKSESEGDSSDDEADSKKAHKQKKKSSSKKSSKKEKAKTSKADSESEVSRSEDESQEKESTPRRSRKQKAARKSDAAERSSARKSGSKPKYAEVDSGDNSE